MNNSSFLSFAGCTGDKVVTNDDLSKVVETSDEWISSRTGIRERFISTNRNTSELCIEAGKKAIEKANIDPLEIDLIIVATITPDCLTPSTACLVQAGLGAKNALAYDINAACSGFVFATATADKFIKSGIYRTALVFGGETLSKVLDWNDRSTCVLFGDGAGAAVMRADGNACGIIAEDLHSDGSMADAIVAGNIPLKNPYANEDDKGMFLTMNGRDVFNFATKTVPKSVSAVLEKSNLTIDDIKYIVPHQANYRIVEVMAKKLQTSMDKFYLNIDRYGNTSAASIPLALAEMSEKGLLKKGDRIIITGFGGGLTYGTLLMEI